MFPNWCIRESARTAHAQYVVIKISVRHSCSKQAVIIYFGSKYVYIAPDKSETDVDRGASNGVEYAKLNHQPLTGPPAPSRY